MARGVGRAAVLDRLWVVRLQARKPAGGRVGVVALVMVVEQAQACIMVGGWGWGGGGQTCAPAAHVSEGNRSCRRQRVQQGDAVGVQPHPAPNRAPLTRRAAGAPRGSSTLERAPNPRSPCPLKTSYEPTPSHPLHPGRPSPVGPQPPHEVHPLFERALHRKGLERRQHQVVPAGAAGREGRGRVRAQKDGWGRAH